MNPLPWYVVHGTAAWGLAALACAVLVALLAWVVPRGRARWRARTARRAIAHGMPREVRWVEGAAVRLTGTLALAPGSETIRGLDGEMCALVTAVTADGRAVSVAAGPLSLVVGEHAVALDGAPEVRAGAVELARARPFTALAASLRERLAAADPHGALAAAAARHVAVRAVRAGDAVCVAGVLALDTAEHGAAANYRGVAGARWRLAPVRLTPVSDDSSPPARAGLAVASARAPRVRGPGGARVLLAAAVGALGFAVSSAGAAKWALAVARRQMLTVHPGSRADLPEPDLAVRVAGLAATVPGLRGRALEALSEALEVRARYERRGGEQAVAVHLLRGDRCAAARLLVAHGEFARGAALAHEAGGRRLEAEALYAQGEFVAASDALARGAPEGCELPYDARPAPRLGFDARVHLLAGRFARAAGAVRATSLRGATSTRECVALAIAARGGDGAALERLRVVAEEPSIERNYTATCRVLLADLVAGEAREGVLERGAPDASDEAIRWLYDTWRALAAESGRDIVAGGRVSELAPADVLLRADRFAHALPPALAQSAFEVARSRPTWRAERFGYATLLAGFASTTGDVPAARRWSAAIVAEVADDATDPAPGVMVVDQVFDGEPPPPPDVGEVRELARVGWDRALALAEGVVAPDADRASGLEHCGSNAWVAMPYCADTEALVRVRAGVLESAGLNTLRSHDLLDAHTEPAWRLAAAGDGAALAEWLTRHRANGDALLRVGAPHVRADGRAALREWVQWTDATRCVTCPLTEQTLDLGRRVMVLRALGASSRELAPLAASLARLRAAALRRDVAVPLTVLERLDRGVPDESGVPISDLDFGYAP